MASDAMPTGLKRNQLAWLTNGTVRGGGISQRLGWKPIVTGLGSDLYQGGYLYSPDFADPHLILSIGGRIIKIRVDTDNSVTDLSAISGLVNPPLEEHGYLVQGEQFVVIQAGDLVTKPLFYDGTKIWRSNGFVGVGNPTNEIPPATAMDYYMGRLWYTIGRTYVAGDIVGSKVSGTAPYNYRDSILKCTENPVALAGDGFIVPTSAGNIRALKHSANLNTALGEGQLYVFTRNSIYGTSVPVKRADWSTLTEPLQRVAQIRFGSYSDRSIVAINGDLYYNSPPNGDIRSLLLAIRYFDQPGNVPLSRNENRVLRLNDRSLLKFASGIEFDNRLLQTVLPIQTPVGAAHRGIIPLDFDLISSLEERLPPVWEGMLEGVSILQLFEGDFGGRARAFAVVYGRDSGQIEIWELTLTDRFDQQDDALNGNRVSWYFETPSYTWNNVFGLKKLDGLDIWIDKLLGKVEFRVQYRVDQDPCWRDWGAWTECSAKDCIEDPESPSCPAYPTTPYCEGFRPAMSLGPPSGTCDKANDKLTTLGFQFQFRVIIKGWCRVRGLMAYAIPVERGNYQNIVC